MSATNDDRSIGEHEWHSSDYVDWWITRDLTRDAERRQRLREMLSFSGFSNDAAFAVLDVGAGYGVVSEEVLRVFPRSRVTLLDYSEPMLAAARERLAEFSDRIDFTLADLSAPDWNDRTGGPFHLAVSAIVIHNLVDLRSIAACYAGIAHALKPGGVFLDYDLFFDKIGGVDHHMALLREAGFARVECLWQQLPLATLKASR